MLWSKQDDEFISKNYNSNNADDLATKLGRTKKSISHRVCFLGLSKKKTNYNYNIDFFKKESPQLAYFFGWLMSDGHISKKPSIVFSIHPKDKEIIEYFQNIIGGHIRYHKQYNKKRKKFYKKCTWSINSKKIINILQSKYNFFIGLKTGKEFIPSIKKKYLSHFVRGVFDGDGWCVKSGNAIRFGICSANKKFLKDLIKIIGLKTKIKKIKTIWQINYYGQISGFSFRNYVYNNDFFSLSRKKNIAFSVNLNNLKCKRFNNEEINIIKKSQNISRKKLAKKLGRSREVIQNKIKELGLQKQLRNKYTKIDEQYILNNIDKDNWSDSISKIAKHLNRTEKAIQRKLNNMELSFVNKSFSNEELYLLKQYSNNIPYLCNILNRSEKSIRSKLWKIK